MTLIEVLEDCIQKVDSIRLPVAEAANILQLTGIAENLRACINALSTQSPEGEEGQEAPEGDIPEGDAPEAEVEGDSAEEGADHQETDEEEDLFGEKEGGKE